MLNKEKVMELFLSAILTVAGTLFSSGVLSWVKRNRVSRKENLCEIVELKKIANKLCLESNDSHVIQDKINMLKLQLNPVGQYVSRSKINDSHIWNVIHDIQIRLDNGGGSIASQIQLLTDFILYKIWYLENKRNQEHKRSLLKFVLLILQMGIVIVTAIFHYRILGFNNYERALWLMLLLGCSSFFSAVTYIVAYDKIEKYKNPWIKLGVYLLFVFILVFLCASIFTIALCLWYGVYFGNDLDFYVFLQIAISTVSASAFIHLFSNKLESTYCGMIKARDKKYEESVSPRAMIFCSNPVNGGTAQVFHDVVEQLQIQQTEYTIIPCVNKDNDVCIYRELSNLQRLDVLSEDEILGVPSQEVSIFVRIPRRIIRNLKYRKTKKNNIEYFVKYILENNFSQVMIHNGGYIGDDLCNQLLIASKLAGVSKRIMVFHSDMHKSLFRKMLCWKYDCMLNEYATKIITVSKYTRNRILSSSYIDHNIEVIYNGIAPSSIENYEMRCKRIGYKKDAIHIGMVGNFLDIKGQLHFLKALDMLLKTYNDENKDDFETKVVVKNQLSDGLSGEDQSATNISSPDCLTHTQRYIQAFIIGNIYDEEYYSECIDFIKKHNLDNIVNICQGIRNAREYYGLFDITVVPSLYDESFGLVGLESMMNSVPVVAYACGGIPEVVRDGIDGYTVEVGNDTEVCKKIAHLIDNPELRLQMGKSGAKRYQDDFTIERMGKAYVDLIMD